MNKLIFITLAITLTLSNSLSKKQGSLSLSGNNEKNYNVDNLNDVSEILNSNINEPHHFSFVQLNASVKEFSYNRLLEEMVDEESSEDTTETNDEQVSTTTASNRVELTRELENKVILRNICIWTPIALGLILFFVVYLTACMSIPKSTILYATYVTNKSDKIN